MESHTQEIIFALLCPRHDLSYVGNVVQDIFLLAAELDHMTFAWIRRARNFMAHHLPTFIFFCISIFFFIRVPDNIVAAVEVDLLLL